MMVKSVDLHSDQCRGVEEWSMLKEHIIHVKKFKIHSQVGTITMRRDLSRRRRRALSGNDALSGGHVIGLGLGFAPYEKRITERSHRRSLPQRCLRHSNLLPMLSGMVFEGFVIVSVHWKI